MTERTFHIIEDFLSPEDCEYFKNRILEKADHDDPKPNFRGMGLFAKETLDIGHYPYPDDPDMKLMRIVEKVQDYYESTYEMYGEFVFSRIFGNIMDTGAFLPSHRDEDPNPDGEFDGKKRSHVCSILLNDDYEGGELIFDDQDTQVKPKPGSLVLFPGYYVSHGVNEITSGSRVNLLVFFYDMLP
jgi:hypothetical protein